eukprot:1156674-Pelagomonas_calceolata.AAC.26
MPCNLLFLLQQSAAYPCCLHLAHAAYFAYFSEKLPNHAASIKPKLPTSAGHCLPMLPTHAAPF